ncbi:HAMP domain-containing histidine kinase [Nocardia otitidiscaviarum]|nr:HAMP domain-containing sensor histidine kinase [Nocardia otitidiscaviarum]MBF6181083.1 HAMP domain-containing histidine kinase [Nocardia otitidiscaviarum]
MRRLGLRGRIAAFFVLAMAAALAGMAAAAYLVVGHQLHSALDTGLRREATRITRQFATEPAVAALSGPCRYLAAPSCVQVVTADGIVESDTRPEDTLPVDDRTRAVANGSAAAYFSDFTTDGLPMRMYTAPLRPGSAVQVAQRADTVSTGQRRVGLALLAAAGVGTLLAAVIGTTLARRALAPVETLTRAAEEVARTRNPDRHIAITGSDELARLAASVNTMLDELDAALTAERDARAAQRRLVADASHELRTPLTALRTDIDLLRRARRLSPEHLDETAAALRVRAEELSGLVTDLIDLARDDDPTAPRAPFEDLRADTLVRDWPGPGPKALARHRFRHRAGTDHRVRQPRAAHPRRHQSARQCRQIQSATRHGPGGTERPEPVGARQRPRYRSTGPAACLRPLLPFPHRPLDTRPRSRTGHRGPSRRRTRRPAHRRLRTRPRRGIPAVLPHGPHRALIARGPHPRPRLIAIPGVGQCAALQGGGEGSRGRAAEVL